MKQKDFLWPIISNQTVEAVLNQLHESISIYDNSGIIGSLEKSLSDYFGMKHSLLLNSGTSALFSIFMAANFKPEDEVICPAYTFFATVTPLLFTGAIPILADCTNNGNIDPEEIRKKITNKTKAVVITHMWGMPCDMDNIVQICKENNLMLFEDISHAFGATYKGKKVGTFGTAAACSLQGQKVITGGEGGFVITNNDEIFYRSLLLGHYNKRCKNEIPQDYELSQYAVTGMGLKLRIHPLAAAIATEQLTKINEILQKRNEYAKRIAQELNKFEDIEVIVPSKNETYSWYALIIKYRGKKFSVKEIHEFLLKEGLNEMDIPNSTTPLHLLPLFQKPEKLFPQYDGKIKYKKGDFPQAEKFYSTIIKMPVWSSDKDVEVVNQYIQGIKKVLTQNG